MISVNNINSGADLFNLISKGQTNAFTSFYTFYFQKLILESDKYVQDIYIAEEIVQDIFLKIWENPDQLLKITVIKPYLYRCVINASINYLNKQKNLVQHHLNISSAITEEQFNELDEENELIVLLNQEIEKLPAKCRKIFKMSRFEHLKYKEIAAMLDISERTVENHISNAIKTLKIAILNSNKNIKTSKSFKKIMMLYLY